MKPRRNPVRVGVTVISTVVFAGCLASLSLPSAVRAQHAPAPKRVVVLDWYNKDHPWNIKFDEGFQHAMKSAPAGAVDYYFEYLETNRFPGENQSLLFRNYLRQKYADRPIDAVVADSDASLDFLLKARDDLFTSVPMVFVATKPPSVEEQMAGPGLTGIINLNTYRETLDLALRLHPHTKEVFVISGTLENDKRFETLAREELRGFEDMVEITYLTDLPLPELVERTESAPQRSIIFYVWQQSRNERGAIVESIETISAIARSTSVPIYGMNFMSVYLQSEDSSETTGIVGGYASTASDCAGKTGEIVLRILDGAKAQEIPIENAPTVPVFDWRELRRWGISEDQLPAGSIVRFKQLTFWEQYKWQLLGAFSVFSLEGLLITFLLLERSRRRGAT